MTTPVRLLPDPERPYSALRDDLVRLGWVWDDEPQTLPLVPGEPEWVSYRHPAGGRLRYEFNPAVWLRQIQAEGPAHCLEALGGLPRLLPDDVARLLDSGATEAVVRGLFAVRALQWLPLLPRVVALRGHPDEFVRRVAADVAATLPGEAVSEAWERLRALRTAYPDRSALLTVLPAADRRQVLRWLGADFREADENVLAALRSGLADDDAEVRATAALVAARLRATSIAPTVDRLGVPPIFADAVARARAALVAGTQRGLPDVVDDATLLLSALVEPLPLVPPPGDLPRHLRVDDGRVRLARSGVEVALVPAVPHWLGGGGGPEQPRRLTPRPFAVATAPVGAAVARMVGLDVPESEPLLLDAVQAPDLARRIASLEDVPVALPTDDQWECALRGPDGRRFPGGNECFEPALSPWGALAVPGPEWVDGGRLRDCADLPARPTPAREGTYPARVALAFPL